MKITEIETQITLYYVPGYKGTQTLAYAKAAGIPIREVDYLKTPFTGRQILELADLLGIPVDEMIDKESELFLEKFNHGANYEVEDWIKIIRENPELLRTPIAIRGDKAIIINTPTDILNL